MNDLSIAGKYDIADMYICQWCELSCLELRTHVNTSVLRKITHSRLQNKKNMFVY